METPHAYDLGMLYFFGSLHRPWLDPIARTFTHLGDYPVLIGVVLVAAGVFLLLRQRRLALVVVVTALLSLGVEWGVKLVVQRPRPEVTWALIPVPHEPSFPSGHALCSLAIYGCIGLLAARLISPRWRKLPVALGVGLGVLVGLTRPYLGVHYPLDVLGGWIAGLACALLGSTLAGAAHSPRAESSSPPA
jgi:undecaprenyl-diphosphatase